MIEHVQTVDLWCNLKGAAERLTASLQNEAPNDILLSQYVEAAANMDKVMTYVYNELKRRGG